MKKLLTFCSIVLASTCLTSIQEANANPIPDLSPSPLQRSGSSYLIASPFRTEISPAHQQRRHLMEMLVLQLEMQDLAQEVMQSDSPDMKAIAEEVMGSSEKMSSKLMKMLQDSPQSLQPVQESVSKN